MASYYLYSGAVGTADGSSWTNAFTTFVAAAAVMVAGDTCYVADDHTTDSTAATVTLTAPGTYANKVRFICAKRVGGSVPPVSADLKNSSFLTVTGSSHSLILNGVAYFYGTHFQAGSGSSTAMVLQIGSAANTGIVLDNCDLFLGTTAASAFVLFGAGSATAISMGRHTLKNSKFTFKNAAQGIQLANGGFDWTQGSVNSAQTAPAVLFLATDLYPGFTHVRDVDLSFVSGTLCGAFQCAQRIIFERCKLNASVTIAVAQVTPGAIIDVINCDSGTKSYRNERYSYSGTLTTETTDVVAGGASDGFAPFSHKIATTANASSLYPFESFPMGEFYAGSVGIAVSQTFELLTDNVTLTNADAWIDLEYMGSSATPLGSVATSGPADPLAGSSNLTTSSASWTTAGLTTPVKQKIAVSFTPQLVGLYRAVLRVAKPSTTLWLNPPATKAA